MIVCAVVFVYVLFGSILLLNGPCQLRHLYNSINRSPNLQVNDYGSVYQGPQPGVVAGRRLTGLWNNADYHGCGSWNAYAAPSEGHADCCCCCCCCCDNAFTIFFIIPAVWYVLWLLLLFVAVVGIFEKSEIGTELGGRVKMDARTRALP